MKDEQSPGLNMLYYKKNKFSNSCIQICV